MMRNPHAGQSFTTSDEEIAEALLDVSIPTLMLSLVHMSGDPGLIRTGLKPAGLFLNEVQGYMSDDDKAAHRRSPSRSSPTTAAAAARSPIPSPPASSGDDAVAGLRARSPQKSRCYRTGWHPTPA